MVLPLQIHIFYLCRQTDMAGPVRDLIDIIQGKVPPELLDRVRRRRVQVRKLSCYQGKPDFSNFQNPGQKNDMNPTGSVSPHPLSIEVWSRVPITLLCVADKFLILLTFRWSRQGVPCPMRECWPSCISRSTCASRPTGKRCMGDDWLIDCINPVKQVKLRLQAHRCHGEGWLIDCIMPS